MAVPDSYREKFKLETFDDPEKSSRIRESAKASHNRVFTLLSAEKRS